MWCATRFHDDFITNERLAKETEISLRRLSLHVNLQAARSRGTNQPTAESSRVNQGRKTSIELSAEREAQ